MSNTEYTYDNLPLVIQEPEATITGTGDATVMHAGTLHVHSGLLRVHGTTSNTPTYVNAYGDAIVLAYGNVAVTARETARVYAYNNAYVVTQDNSSAEIFGAGVLVTNDNSQGILYDTAEAISHGNSRILLYGNSSAVAMDTSILSVRDASHAITRGYSQAYIYDTASAVSYDTSSLSVNSPLAQVEARNASTVTINEQLIQHITQQGRYILFTNPSNPDKILGQIHISDEAAIASELPLQSDGPMASNQETEDSSENTAELDSVQQTQQEDANASDKPSEKDETPVAIQKEEPKETPAAESDTEVVPDTVADLLARARKAKPQFAQEPPLTPEPIKATPRSQASRPIPLQDEEDTNNLIADTAESESDSLLDASFTVDLSDNNEDHEVSPDQQLPETKQEATEPQTASTIATEHQEVIAPSSPVVSLEDASEVIAPQGDTAIAQLNNQGWHVLTEPTGKQVDFEYTEPRDNANLSSSTSGGNSSEKKITGGFDFDDEEEEDEFIPTIPGQR